MFDCNPIHDQPKTQATDKTMTNSIHVNNLPTNLTHS
jgi:hypothetical protein